MRNALHALLALIVCAAAAPNASHAATRFVPGTYATVQAAVTASNSGDIIEVSPGTYTVRNIRLQVGEDLTFRAADPNNRPIFDAGGSSANPNRRHFFHDEPSDGVRENTTLVFRDIIFENGYIEDERALSYYGSTTERARGGSLWLRGDRATDGGDFNVTIENCLFRNNRTFAVSWGGGFPSYGGAICFQGDDRDDRLTITRCVFVNNICRQNDNGGNGGAVCVRNASGKICNSTFYQNDAVGGTSVDGGDMGDDRVVGGAICAVRYFGGLRTNATVDVDNCIFQGNEARNENSVTGTKGGACARRNVGSGSNTLTLDVRNSIFFSNTADVDANLHDCTTGGNTTSNPDMINPSAGDFRLDPCTSPAVDAGSASVGCGTTTDGQPDLGAYEVNALSAAAPAGVTVTWTGTVSTDWHDPCNWDVRGIPGPTNPTIIDGAPADQPVISAANADVLTLEVETTTGGNLQIQGTRQLEVHQ